MDLLDIHPDRFSNDRHLVSDQTKRICIIGGGPAGLAALKIILDTSQYKQGLWKPTVFEARENVGGVWLPAAPVDDPPLTPLYDSLTTNLPHPIMAYTSFPFPPSTPVFPHAAVVQTYLESYTSHFKFSPYIRLNTLVKTAQWGSKNWNILLSTGENLTFDLVIVTNGHYRLPRYPNTPGLSKWLEIGKATHSAWYRHPHNLGKTILVVGGGPSGQDISAEMRTAAETVIHSVTSATAEDVGNLKRRGRVIEYQDDGQVVFEDGTKESKIDHCILATGYEMSFPFLNSIIREGFPPPSPPLPRELHNSSYHVFPLAKHIFPLQGGFPPTSLAFMGLLIRVAPFPLLEAQARAIVHAFAHPDSLDTTREAVDVITRYEELRLEYNDDPIAIANAWHRFKDHEQFDYRDAMHEFATSVPRGDGDAAGSDMKVPGWVKEMYDRKDVLRKVWIDLERNGEAESWVRGVGENGEQEWIDLMKKMLKRGDGEEQKGVARL